MSEPKGSFQKVIGILRASIQYWENRSDNKNMEVILKRQKRIAMVYTGSLNRRESIKKSMYYYYYIYMTFKTGSSSTGMRNEGWAALWGRQSESYMREGMF